MCLFILFLFLVTHMKLLPHEKVRQGLLLAQGMDGR